ncbi:RagB/SusD family nutrient uptake outer membrane protein [Mucilaginibacter sp.]|uniref:RagB/SusD family nutrient uptake outer membrane protein n=1 Tax=Mucilaginibacter sp. TaxID=1882438 RepID=UPI002ED5EBAD
MKHKILLALLICLLFGACKKQFLDKTPISQLSAVDFYKSQSDFDQAVVGIYVPLRPLYGVGLADYGAWSMGEMRSDNTCFIFNFANRGYADREGVETFLDDVNGGGASNKYDNDYIIIGRANQVLAQIDNVGLTGTAKDNDKGQALFLRAFAYFDLVQYFGDVPMVLAPPTTYDQTQVGRTAVADVYKQIIADATAAAALLPLPANQTKGHVAKGAAYTLLGNVNIVLKQWAAAETALKNVSGYSLLPDYASVFDPNNKNNAESIFEIQYWDDPAAGQASNFAYNFLPILADPGVISGFPSGSSNTYAGWNTPTPDLIAAYEAGDKRLNASIGFYTGGIYVNIPYIKKYVHGAKIAPNTNDDFPVYRYAETLLLLAEALNEQGKSGEALTALNQVHANVRTGLTPIAAADQATLRNAILHERQIELAFENKRWLDLVRTGTAAAVMNAQGAKIKANPKAYYYPTGISPVQASYNVTTSRLLFPIPAREVQINPKLTQNPGY